MNILSVHYGHDSSCCILKDGELISYFKEERYSKIKRDDIPFISIKKCLENFDEKITHITVSSIDTLFDQNIKLIIKFISCFIDIPKDENIIKFSNNHHLTHASISFFNSGFEESICIVVDGRGCVYKNQIAECESSYFISLTKGIKPLIKNYFTPSYIDTNEVDENTYNEIVNNSEYEGNIFNWTGGVVNLYTTATFLIGEKMSEAGKVMGLSSYGEKIKNFPKLFLENSLKIDEKNYQLYKYNNFKYKEFPIFKEYIGKDTKEITEQNYKFYADYAYEIQTQTQKSVGDFIEKSIEKTNVKNVCISGGYGMNVVANYYYLQRFPDVNFYFEPLSDDSGCSIGASKIFYFLETKKHHKNPIKTTSFHGIKYDVSKYKGTTKTIKDIAKILFNNNSIAVYSGLSESGQRALGNRSILFNPLNSDAKNIVNIIKKREWYRPFAAVVLEEDAGIYFNMGKITSSPFMTICFPVKNQYTELISGVTHIDNTCRIQTISKNNGYLYNLLKEFKLLSGHGILLNTSFNLAGDPLVETPEDAFEVLTNSCLDYLWFEETNQLFKNVSNTNTNININM